MRTLIEFFSRRRTPPTHVPPSSEAQVPAWRVASRHGSLIRLRPEYEERYIILHRHVFPGVLERIRRCSIRNYSIFLDEGILFAYFEYGGNDFTADMAAMADDVTKEWWKLTDPMQVPLKTRKKGEWWTPMEFIARLGGEGTDPEAAMRYVFRTKTGRATTRRIKTFCEKRHALLEALLAKHGLLNACVYQRDGWLYLYCEHRQRSGRPGPDALLDDREFGEVAKQFDALANARSRRTPFRHWRPMREVFHTP